MTEKKWLSSRTDWDQFYRMTQWLESRRTARRKLRLWGCACCRRLGDRLKDERSWAAIAASEQFADGEIDRAAFQTAKLQAQAAWYHHESDYPHYAAMLTANIPISTAASTAAINVAIGTGEAGVRSRAEEQAVQIGLLRDIFGNPFRPVKFAPAWRTDTAVAIARGMYESRDFSPMPILADALQDAGCDNDDILNHCRDANGVHVRGCWVVDLVLGKE